MEIWKGPVGQCVKVYESELFVDEFSRDFCIKQTDAELCNCDKNLPIEFRFINRNQYKMVNTEAVRVTCSL